MGDESVSARMACCVPRGALQSAGGAKATLLFCGCCLLNVTWGLLLGRCWWFSELIWWGCVVVWDIRFSYTLIWWVTGLPVCVQLHAAGGCGDMLLLCAAMGAFGGNDGWNWDMLHCEICGGDVLLISGPSSVLCVRVIQHC